MIAQVAPPSKITGSKDYYLFSSGITSTTTSSTKNGTYDFQVMASNSSVFGLTTMIGMGIYDVNGNYMNYQKVGDNQAIGSQVTTTMTLSGWGLPLSTLSDGTYYLRVVYTPSKTTGIRAAKIIADAPNALRLKISGNNVKVENAADYAASSLSLTSLSNSSAFYKGTTNTISATIANSASYDFYSYCAIMLVDGSGNKTLCDKKLVTVAANGSSTVSFTIDAATLSLGSYTAYLVIDKYNYPLNTAVDLYSLGDAATVNVCPYLDEAATSNTVPSATYSNIKLKRTFTSGHWSTICLPFALTSDQINAAFGSGTSVANLTGVSGNKLDFTTVTGMNANTPYLIKPATISSDNIYLFTNVSATDGTPAVTVGSGSNTAQFIGTYVSGGNVPANSFFIQDNKFYKASTAIAISGYRAYLTVTVPDAAKQMDISVDGETGIDGIHTDGNSVFDVYQINGQLIRSGATSLEGLSKGVYIINGKKTVIN